MLVFGGVCFGIVWSVPAFFVPRLVFLALDWRLVPLGVMLVYVGSCIQG